MTFAHWSSKCWIADNSATILCLCRDPIPFSLVCWPFTWHSSNRQTGCICCVWWAIGFLPSNSNHNLWIQLCEHFQWYFYCFFVAWFCKAVIHVLWKTLIYTRLRCWIPPTSSKTNMNWSTLMLFIYRQDKCR